MNRTHVIQAIARVLRIDSQLLHDDDGLGRTEGWDSLAHLEILERLESDSGTRLTGEETLYSETVEELVGLFQTEF